MQTRDDLDHWYQNVDPWTYTTHPDDAVRKARILEVLSRYGTFNRALDLGCGEGWITQDLPARIIHGYELSNIAASRLPDVVKRTLDPYGEYDLVIATGVLYPQYDWQNLVRIIRDRSSHIVLTCHIKSWLVPAALEAMPGRQVFEMEFPYREWTQSLRVFNVVKHSEQDAHG